MDAIILVGGRGTRLRLVVSDVPKPMAPISGEPFLKFLLDYLDRSGINRVILATGYMHEKIKDYFGMKYKNIDLIYSIEEAPLGTGGAIKKALELVSNNNALIINGDTFFNVNIKELVDIHIKAKANLTLSLKHMENFDRYGTVLFENERIIGFEEKKSKDTGFINGGVYIANKNLFADTMLQEKFSFESDFLEKYLTEFLFTVYISDGYFIDIGIPEDYQRAQEELLIFDEK